ncbi:uncharacterized protein LOC120642976 [Panicum virgatum]|uniref:uncharacterized protein LOC120642976 n=1 Tax=Panicum virgatum TaxID=38727 RepID=UPI0019D63BE3|nr:uncharacterized protein LOC120642976 [Panicum virgatum]
MSMNDYCTKLKRIADQLRDISYAVSEPSQVLNLLRGLNPRYRYVKPVITSKFPPHTFQSTRSFLILEELSFQHDSNDEAGQAFTASHSDHSGGSSSSVSSGAKDGSSAPPAQRSNNRSGHGNGGGNPRSNNRSDRRHDRNNGGGNSPSNANGNTPNTQSAPWAAGYNPWQGMVQTWPMPFRAPGAGVLGARPPFQPQQAMVAASHPSNVFDTSAFYAALPSSGVPHQPPTASD